ncbi:hypothetical protein MHYP_G00162660 [Metynnis hypsauchen]
MDMLLWALKLAILLTRKVCCGSPFRQFKEDRDLWLSTEGRGTQRKRACSPETEEIRALALKISMTDQRQPSRPVFPFQNQSHSATMIGACYKAQDISASSLATRKAALLSETCRNGFCFHVRATACHSYFWPSRPLQGLDTFGQRRRRRGQSADPASMRTPDKMPGGSQRCLSEPWHGCSGR